MPQPSCHRALAAFFSSAALAQLCRLRRGKAGPMGGAPIDQQSGWGRLNLYSRLHFLLDIWHSFDSMNAWIAFMPAK